MFLGLHTYSVYANINDSTTKTHKQTTIRETRLIDCSELIDIELCEVEDDNETESEVEMGNTLNVFHVFQPFACTCLTTSIVTPQSPTLFYKSQQSYLEVFRI
jgi:hypothetical protein